MVRDGTGSGVVVHTGTATAFGQIAPVRTGSVAEKVIRSAACPGSHDAVLVDLSSLILTSEYVEAPRPKASCSFSVAGGVRDLRSMHSEDCSQYGVNPTCAVC